MGLIFQKPASLPCRTSCGVGFVPGSCGNEGVDEVVTQPVKRDIDRRTESLGEYFKLAFFDLLRIQMNKKNRPFTETSQRADSIQAISL